MKTIGIAAWMLCSPVLFSQRHPGKLDTLLAEADAVAAVRILSTDYTATAADGPMYAEARVLKALKGRLPEGGRIVFGASAWLGPSYGRGEHRVVFLHRVPRNHAYFQKALWSTTETGTADVFLDTGSLAGLTAATLEDFLRRAARAEPPKLEVKVIRRNSAGADLSIRLANGHCLSPDRIATTLMAHNVHYALPVRWMELSGTARLSASQIKGAAEVIVAIANRGVRYPCPSWVGTVTAQVKP